MEQVDGRTVCLIIKKLLGYTTNKDQKVRARTCQLVGTLMEALGPEDDSEGERSALYEEIVSKLLPCLNDKQPQVRAAAVIALYRLHDPTDETDDVLAAMLALTADDTKKESRKMVLDKLNASAITLPHYLRMTQDIAPDVRFSAYGKISRTITLAKIALQDRIGLVVRGLGDRDEGVRKAATDMFLSWLGDGDPVEFLRMLSVEQYTQEIEPLCLVIAQHVLSYKAQGSQAAPGMWQPQFNSMSLSPEAVVLWRVLYEELHKTANVVLYDFIPDLSQFCKVLTAFFVRLASKLKAPEDSDQGSMFPQSVGSNEFILSQLLQICTLLDFDEVGRAQLIQLLKQVIVVVNLAKPDQLVKEILALFRAATKHSRKEYTKGVHTAVATLLSVKVDENDEISRFEQRDHLLVKRKHAVATVSLEESAGRGGSRLAQMSLAEAERYQRMISQTDTFITRALHIVADFLEHAPRGTVVVEDDAFAAAISDGIKYQDRIIYPLALRCLGLRATLDMKIAHTHVPTFFIALHSRSQELQALVLHCLFDIVFEHGFAALNFTGAPRGQQVMDVLLQYLCLGGWFHERDDDDDDDCRPPSGGIAALRCVATQGFIKLLCANKCLRADRPMVVAQLILNKFNPVLKTDLSSAPEGEEVDVDILGNEPDYRTMDRFLQLFFNTFPQTAVERLQLTLEGCVVALRHLLHNSYAVLPLSKKPRGCQLVPNRPMSAKQLAPVLKWIAQWTNSETLMTKADKPLSLHERLVVDVGLEALSGAKQALKILPSLVFRGAPDDDDDPITGASAWLVLCKLRDFGSLDATTKGLVRKKIEELERQIGGPPAAELASKAEGKLREYDDWRVQYYAQCITGPDAVPRQAVKRGQSDAECSEIPAKRQRKAARAPAKKAAKPSRKRAQSPAFSDISESSASTVVLPETQPARGVRPPDDDEDTEEEEDIVFMGSQRATGSQFH
eukprot:TRINITY_DN20214_c0_g1_i2.p1 TRINITY_DN20214_c0_g1~~TRINITY_DN20214_c0_g1_i2.p1  ORF type:complete len:1049 (-),score=212.12 TRINITY_DN20214_c0_g1_i2:75-2954(-)